jgi:hypothetical protein
MKVWGLILSFCLTALYAINNIQRQVITEGAPFEISFTIKGSPFPLVSDITWYKKLGESVMEPADMKSAVLVSDPKNSIWKLLVGKSR